MLKISASEILYSLQSIIISVSNANSIFDYAIGIEY